MSPPRHFPVDVAATAPLERQYDENWQVVALERPSETVLYEWLNHATAKKRVRREGQGTRSKPWRYRLPNEDDAYYDRGELPPLKPLFG